MIAHDCMQFCAVYHLLCEEIDLLKQKEPQSLVSSKEKLRIHHSLWEQVETEALNLDILRVAPHIFDAITTVTERLESGDRLSSEVLMEKMKAVQRQIVFKLMELKFAYIPPPHSEYLEKAQLFGEAVDNKFPSVRQELKDAGNCLAADLGTAAVFHLMRVAERGMKALLTDRGVTFTNNKPLELQDWKTMLDGLEIAIKKIDDWPNSLGSIKTQALSFYSNAKQEFHGFKGAWRNHVMHDRTSYTFDDAVAIVKHVQRFMQALAMRISESSQTPTIWTEKEVL